MKLDEIVSKLITYLKANLVGSKIVAKYNYVDIDNPLIQPNIAISLSNIKVNKINELSYDIELNCYLPQLYNNIYEYLSKVAKAMQNWELPLNTIVMKKIDNKQPLNATQYCIIVNYGAISGDSGDNPDLTNLISVLKYKDYIFSGSNQYKLTYSKDIRIMQHIDTNNGALIQALGYHPRTITGTGVFTGESMWYNYTHLAKQYRSQVSGFLVLHALEPINAHFKTLKLVSATPQALTYEFEFCEDPSKTYPPTTGGYWDVISDDETLWFVSEKSKVSVEKLLLLNPSIKSTGFLPKGMKVMLK